MAPSFIVLMGNGEHGTIDLIMDLHFVIVLGGYAVFTRRCCMIPKRHRFSVVVCVLRAFSRYCQLSTIGMQ